MEDIILFIMLIEAIQTINITKLKKAVEYCCHSLCHLSTPVVSLLALSFVEVSNPVEELHHKPHVVYGPKQNGLSIFRKAVHFQSIS